MSPIYRIHLYTLGIWRALKCSIIQLFPQLAIAVPPLNLLYQATTGTIPHPKTSIHPHFHYSHTPPAHGKWCGDEDEGGERAQRCACNFCHHFCFSDVTWQGMGRLCPLPVYFANGEGTTPPCTFLMQTREDSIVPIGFNTNREVQPLVYSLGRGQVEIWAPDPTPVDNLYPSYSGRVTGQVWPGLAGFWVRWQVYYII